MRKVTMKMWRSVLSVMLALSMMLAPCTSAFAAPTVNVEDDGVINYVVLGDSMTNGYCMSGYYPVDSTDAGNVRGYKRLVNDTYPVLFADYLGETTGKEVAVDQLAISGIRAEELHFLLNDKYAGDAYTADVFDSSNNEGERWFHKVFRQHEGYVQYDYDNWGNARLRAEYKEALTNADVISIAVGTNNFGTFLSGELKEMVLGDERQYDIADIVRNDAQLAKIIGEEALAQIEPLRAKLTAVASESGYPGEMVTELVDMFMYAYIGFVVNYTESISIIREWNPDAQIILMGLMNTMEGIKLTLAEGQEAIDVDNMFALLIDAANAYMAGLDVVTQATLDAPKAIYVGTDKVHLMVDVMAEKDVDAKFDAVNDILEWKSISTLASNVEDFLKPGDRNPSISIKWEDLGEGVGISNYGSIPAGLNVEKLMDDIEKVAVEKITGLMMGNIMADLADEDLIKHLVGCDDRNCEECRKLDIAIDLTELVPVPSLLGYTTLSANEVLGFNLEATLVEELYLGLREAIFTAAANAELSFADLGALANGDVLANVMSLIADPLMEAVNKNMDKDETNDVVIHDAVAESILSVDVLKSALHIYARNMAAEGMGIHPDAQGHKEIFEAMKNAWENEVTSEDLLLEELEELAALIKEYGPGIAKDAYTWAEENGYIDQLENALAELKVKVEAEIKNIEEEVRPIILEKIAELEAELEALKADLEAKVAEFDAMLKDLNAKLAELKAELEAKKAELEDAAEEAKAEIEKAIAEIEAMIKAIEKAIEDAKAAVEAVKAQIEAVKAEIEVLKTQLADINEKLEALYDAAVELDVAIRELIEITKEGLDADLEDVEAAIQSALNKVEKAIVVTQEAVKAVADFVADIQAKVEAVVGEIAVVKEAVEAVYNTYIAVLEKVNADIKAALETINADVLAALEAVKAELNAEAMAQIEAIKAALEEKIAAVRAEVEALYAEQLAVLEGKIAELEAAIEAKKAELENAAEELKAEIEAEIARLEAELAAKKAELEALLAQIEAEISAAVEEFKAEAEAKIAEILAALEEAIAKLEEEANAKLEELNGALNTLVKEAYAALEAEIAKVAETIATEVAAELEKLDATIKATAEEVKAVVEEKLSAMEAALTETFEKCRRAYNVAYHGTLTGEYVVDEDSYYVSLGDSTVTGFGLEGYSNYGYGVKVPGSFPYKLAKELGVDYAALGQGGLRVEDLRYILDETYVPDEYTLTSAVADFNTYGGGLDKYRETFKAEIEKADLVTIGIGSNNFTTFVTSQINRILAGKATYEMDWSRFVSKEGVPAVEKVLETIKAELVKAGMDTEIALGGNTVNAADAVTKLIECYAYGYAGFAYNYAEVLNKVHEINPEALVVVVGAYNTLDRLNIDLGNGEIAVGDYLEKFLTLTDIHFTAYAMMTPNTTYVTVPETETFFDAETADKEELTIVDYLLAMTTDNGKAMHANDAGHTYIKNRIYDSLIKKETVNGFYLESDSWKFTGKEIRPLVLNRFGYVEGYDFNVEYVNNVEPGKDTAKVIITGLFDDVKDTELSFTIKVVENFITADKGTVVPVPETGVETEDGTVVKPVPEKDFDLSDARIEAMTGYAESFDQVYTGKALKPAVKVYHGTDLLVAGKDYTVSYKNNTKAFVFDEVDFAGMTEKQLKAVKIPTITIKGKGNYTGTQTIHFDILRKDLADVTYTYKNELMYSGKKLSTSFAMKNGTVSMKNKTDYTVEYFKDGESVKEVKAAGEYTMVVTGKGNYEGVLELPISVKSKADGFKALSKLSISAKSVEFGGNIADGVVVKDGKTVLTNGVDYVLEYDEEAVVNAGKHKVVVTGIDKYVGSKTVTVTVKGISLAKATVKGLAKSVVYTGEEFKPNGEDFEVTLKVKEGKTYVTKTLVENVDYVITYSSNVTNKGTVKLTFKGIGNYTGSFTKSFTVAAYKFADAIANGDIEIVVDDAATFSKNGAKAGVKVLFKGEELVNGKDYTLSYSNTKKEFDYEEGMTSKQLKSAPKVVVKAKGNFSGSFTAYYDIVAKDFAELTVVAPNVYYANKKGNFKTTVTVLDENGKKLTSGKDYKVTYVDANGNEIDAKATLDAGAVVTVKVTAVAGKGYAGEQVADIQILQAKLSKLMINKLSFWYTGKAIKLTAEDLDKAVYMKTKTFPFIDELEYGVDYEIVEGTYANNVNKGTASVTIKGIGNYAGTYTVTYKIVARPTWLNIYDKLVK